MITQSGRMLLLLLFFGSRKRRKAGKKERKTLSPLHLSVNNSLAQAPRLALRLQQREDVALADGALDVAHDEAVLVVKELDADLGDLFFFFLVLGFFGFEFLETRGAEEVSKERRMRERSARDESPGRALSIGATPGSSMFLFLECSYRRRVHLLDG